MTEPIRWGILGTGWIAEQQVDDLLLHGFTVAAVGSRSQGSADAFAAKYGIATAHGSYEALASDPGVDVIYVATPHPFHEQNALLAIAGGKHVLVEKPFAMSAAQAARITAAAEAAGVVALEAMWTRFLPHMIRLREILAAGTLGRLRSVTADHSRLLPQDPAHRLNDPALGGGSLLDLGIYPLSFFHDVLGTPHTISAVADKGPTGVDALTSVLLTFADGAHAITTFGSDAEGPNRAIISGTEAWVELDPTWYAGTSFTVRAGADNSVIERFESDYEGRGMQYQAWEVERLVRDGATGGTILPPSATVEVMRTLDAIRGQIGLEYDGVG